MERTSVGGTPLKLSDHILGDHLLAPSHVIKEQRGFASTANDTADNCFWSSAHSLLVLVLLVPLLVSRLWVPACL